MFRKMGHNLNAFEVERSRVSRASYRASFNYGKIQTTLDKAMLVTVSDMLRSRAGTVLAHAMTFKKRKRKLQKLNRGEDGYGHGISRTQRQARSIAEAIRDVETQNLLVKGVA
jgi:hypothetical protein